MPEESLVSQLSSLTLDNEELFGYLRTGGSRLFQEYSGSKLLDIIRQAGYKTSDSKFYELRREVLNIEKHSEQLARRRVDAPIPASLINTEHGLNLQGNFLYRFNASYIDTDTNLPVNTFVSLISDEHLSPQAAKDALINQISITPKGDTVSDNPNLNIGIINTVLARPDTFRYGL